MIAVRMWRIVLIGLASLLLASAVWAQTPETLQSAEQIIVKADALGASRDFDGAIATLTRGIEQYPTYARLYLSLATWQEVRGLYALSIPAQSVEEMKQAFRGKLSQYPAVTKAIFDTYARAVMNAGDDPEVRQQIASLVSVEYPLQLGRYGPVALPGRATPFTYTISDPQLPPQQRGVRQGLITLDPLPATSPYALDPKYGKAPGTPPGDWVFQRMLYAYSYDRASRTWTLRFRVMWQDVAGKSDARADLAQQTARLLLRLSWLADAYGGFTPRFAANGVVNVWLAEHGDAGGEAYDDSIYLYDVSVPRSPGEWIREVAHEYGHQVIPAVGGYVKPEWGANGRLGERLFLRWVLLNPEAADGHPWVLALDPADAKSTRIDTLIRQFAAMGPEAPQMSGDDEQAIFGFVGMALYLEEAYGSDTLTAVLSGMGDPLFAGPKGFLATVEELADYAQSGKQPVVSLRLTALPADIPLWAYLREGAWRGELVGRTDAPLSVAIEVDGKPAIMADGKTFTTGNLSQGWHQIRIVSTGTLPPLATLRLVRQ